MKAKRGQPLIILDKADKAEWKRMSDASAKLWEISSSLWRTMFIGPPPDYKESDESVDFPKSAMLDWLRQVKAASSKVNEIATELHAAVKSTKP